MQLHSKVIAMAVAMALVTGCASTSNNNSQQQRTSTTDGYRQIGYTSWDKTGSVATGFNQNTIPANQSRMVFIRPKSDSNPLNSANIGIDNRYQVSLQGGSYSSVNVCAGDHNVSINPASATLNSLNKGAQQYKTVAGQTQYFYVDGGNNPRIKPINEQTALNALQNNSYTKQTHQLSRVIAANCTAPVKKPTVKVEIDKPITLNVEFDYDKATIRPQYNVRLVAVAKFMAEKTNTVAVIEGHTDSRGNDVYNKSLSERRAAAVRQQLITRYGVDPTRIKSVGYGETRPIASNDTDEGRQRNRRVDALITLKK